MLFRSNDTATTEIYTRRHTLSLHDALPIRLCFGMARDNQLPFSKPLAKVAPKLHTPPWTCIVVALIAAIPFIQFSGAGIVAIAATGMIYLSYFLGNIVIMRARMRGWPKTSAPFRLGRWGPVVNIIGLIYGLAMLINFAWPRPEIGRAHV